MIKHWYCECLFSPGIPFWSNIFTWVLQRLDIITSLHDHLVNVIELIVLFIAKWLFMVPTEVPCQKKKRKKNYYK